VTKKLTVNIDGAKTHRLLERACGDAVTIANAGTPIAGAGLSSCGPPPRAAAVSSALTRIAASRRRW
jgi:hypothetical protein